MAQVFRRLVHDVRLYDEASRQFARYILRVRAFKVTRELKRMKHNETDLLFAVRSLNHWRPLFSPTYLGLRFLLDSTLGKESHWLGAFVSWKFST